MILERLFILLLVVAIAGIAYGAWRMVQARRLSRLADAATPDFMTRFVELGRPALLYFTTEHCAQCRYQQAPILTQLASLAPIPVHRVDALQEIEIARHFGIMTVPTTVILDHTGRPVAINHGLAPLQRLAEQTSGLL